MIMLDLFSGTGSASEPFLDAGWKVYRYDINPTGADGIFADFKHEMFVTSIIDAWQGLKVDLLWASPPCPDYSFANHKTNDPEFLPDTLLWHNTLRIIEGIQPKNFIIENVKGAQRTWGPAVQYHGPYYFWGIFPKFNVPEKIPPKGVRGLGRNGIKGLPKTLRDMNKKLRARESARIPYPIGYYLERAIRLQERWI